MNEASIFLEALEKGSAEARAAFLDKVCAGDAELRDSVERLLRAHERADEVLPHRAPGLPVTTARPASEWIGKRIGPYKLLEQIGEGGFGVVLKARDEKLERVVAIKVLAPELASNPTARKRFLREARAAASVVHQHVVTIHAVDETPFPYLVMECIDGQSLQDKIDREGHLELTEILRIGQQVATGLAAAHAHGLIHRDVKPANILLENSVERVRISDFGLARAVDDVGVTRTGEVAGTPQYMSPEQAQGLPLDARSDLFSFGSVLYAMCTGRSPFRAETTIDAIRRVCDGTPRPIREINPEIPEWLVEITNRLLAKQPGERFQSAQEVAELLDQHLAEVQHPQSSRHASSRHAPRDEPDRDRSIGRAPRDVPKRSPLGLASQGADHAERDRYNGVTSPSEAQGHVSRSETATRRRWAIATVLLLLLVALGLSEATSTTHLTAAVIGLFARKTTPIANTNTPAAAVPPAAQPTPQPESEPFVLLRKSGTSVHKFDTLAEAVQSAASGDTIEIRGNGPFMSKEVVIRKPLTIRAGEGFHPLIKADQEMQESRSLLTAYASLVLEGLELQWFDAHAGLLNFGGRASRIHLANCRFVITCRTGGWASAIACSQTARLRVQNCQILTRGGDGSNSGVYFDGYPGSEMIVDNCLMYGAVTFSLKHEEPVKALLRRNTLCDDFPGGSTVCFSFSKKIEAPLGKDNVRPYQVESVANILESPLNFAQEPRYASETWLSASEFEELVTRVVAWREKGNLYAFDDRELLELTTQQLTSPTTREGERTLSASVPLRTSTDLQHFWATEGIDSQRGVVRFQGENRIASLRRTNTELITPEDFRLRPDSAGYRAGEVGRDIGADVDLVGPGPA